MRQEQQSAAPQSDNPPTETRPNLSSYMPNLGSGSKTEFVLAIIGAGPNCTYALERLSMSLHEMDLDKCLIIHVFDRSGYFGAGEVHAPTQPKTSFLNRIVGQIAFAADESLSGVSKLSPVAERPTFTQWCKRKYLETRDETFNLRPEDWPKRFVHGIALSEMFQTYVDRLNGDPRVRVCLHKAEVLDCGEGLSGRLDISSINEDGKVLSFSVDHALFVTGHTSQDPYLDNYASRLSSFAVRHVKAEYIDYAYPLEQKIMIDVTGPDRTVACIGMGLTAFDVILFLTEGRGGLFEPKSNRSTDGYIYRRSGREPASIVCVSNSGLFTYARPENAKEQDPKNLEHVGIFFNKASIDCLRRSISAGQKTVDKGKLDFELHILPLIQLEMGYAYYKTLFGPALGQRIKTELSGICRDFVNCRAIAKGSTIDLIRALDELVDPVISAVAHGMQGKRLLPEHELCLKQFLEVVFDSTKKQEAASKPTGESPWGHSSDPADHRFSYDRVVNSIPTTLSGTPDGYRQALIAFMRRDNLAAAQNNLMNPTKAACDGVWRDLREVLAYVVDRGGLTPDSHRVFLSKYMRHHNRVANGAALDVMMKIEALVVDGILDVSTGPSPKISCDEASGRFCIEGMVTSASVYVDTLIDAKLHVFDPEKQSLPLYKNMVKRGLITKWTNVDSSGAKFAPGGIDLTETFHPRNATGHEDLRISFLGAPTEGIFFFQIGALRPNQNHHVLRDVIAWTEHLLRVISEKRSTNQASE